MGKGGSPLHGRREVLRAAASANVHPEEIDRARVLGQIAGLLLAHPRLKDNLAYKGGAIMHLVDGSPRRSNDLDANVVTAIAVKEVWIVQALSTKAAQRVVFAPPNRFRPGNDSITVLGLDCRAPSGGRKVQITINISWRTPLCLKHDWLDIAVGTETIRIPVMHQAERCAEKLDAFFNRDEVNDSYDLFHYAPLLKRPDWEELLPEVVHVKLANAAELPDGCNVRELFDSRLPRAEKEWARDSRSLKLPGVPSWDEISAQLVRFRPTLPAKLDHTHRRPRWKT